MRRNSLLLAAIAAMAIVLMAGRCSDDDEGKPAAAVPDEPISKDGGDGRVDGGVEQDPLGGTMGGDSGVPLDEGNDGGTDGTLDDQTFEPQPTPEGAADL